MLSMDVVTDYMKYAEENVEVNERRAATRKAQLRSLIEADTPPSKIVLMTKRMFAAEDALEAAVDVKVAKEHVLAAMGFSDYEKAANELVEAIERYEAAEKTAIALAKEYVRRGTEAEKAEEEGVQY